MQNKTVLAASAKTSRRSLYYVPKQPQKDWHTKQLIESALEVEDYAEFIDAASGTKLGEAIESEADFALLVEAKDLKEAGEYQAAKEIMQELGIERPSHHGHGKWGKGGSMRNQFDS